MRMLDADEASDLLGGLVHLETQRATSGLDLTVDRIDRFTAPGRLDFGGSEFEAAGCEPVEPRLTDPEDDYGWWELEPGSYRVRYNETLATGPGRIGLVHPLPRLLRAGASHAAFVADGSSDPLEALLTVGEAGCGLKENCRISRLLVMETG